MSSSPPAPRRPLVSIVDDDAAMRAALSDLLDSAGCEPRAFSSSEQFLGSDAADASDVIVTDIQMGGLDGLALLTHLRDVLRSPVPVIVITALADEDLKRRAKAGGSFAFLRKPFDPENLLRQVRSAAASR